MFYADYATPRNGSAAGGRIEYDLLYTCAQEICSQRQGGMSVMQHNALIDLAHAYMVMQTAAAWSETLGVDSEWRARWLAVSGGLSPFPETTDAVSLAHGPDGHPLTGNRTVWSEAWDVVSSQPIACTLWNCSCQGFSNYFNNHASVDWGCCTYRQSRWWVENHCNTNPSPGSVHGACPVPVINCSLPSQCLHGGICLDRVGSGWNFGVCECPAGWDGRRCEIEIPSPVPTPVLSPAKFASNYMYPIIHFAPIHPCSSVGLHSDTYSGNDTRAHAVLLATAQNTVWGDNERSAWHPVNGLCLAWPSATRVTDGKLPGRAKALLDRYEAALHSTMQPNFWPSMNGGGLEQVGATVAVNELLLQSHETFLVFFPAWGTGLAASFTTLRARGAFLVSASVTTGGLVGPVTILSEKGAACTFLSPWAAATPPRVTLALAGGKVDVVATIVRGVSVWRFQTTPGAAYEINA